MLRHLTVALIACALAAPAFAFSPAEVRTILQAGSLMTVDRRFTAQDVMSFVGVARDRLTVVCAGFAPEESRRFLGAGSRIVIDSSIPTAEILQLAALGRGRVVVSPAGLSPQVLGQVKAYGCPLLATNGGATFADKMRSLQAGEQAVADSALSAREVQQLVAAGRNRMHVFAKGFTPADVATFVRGGAIVWVDSSMPAPEVLGLARLGGKRVIVRTPGFALDALKQFAGASAQIVFAFDAAKRDQARMAAFEKLHGEI